MKLVSLLSIVLVFGIVFSGFGIKLAVANDDGGVNKISTACFTYEVGTYSSYYWIANLTDEGMGVETGSIAIYDNGSYIFIWVGVWSKPYLAYRELDKDGDGLIDPTATDKNGDGIIDRYDLKSDGINISGIGPGYDWYVDSDINGNPTKQREPEITVPSWDLNLNVGGILDGSIVYIAEIPIPAGGQSFDICIETHASPSAQPPFPIFVIPEVPLGTLGAALALFVALSIFAARKRKSLSPSS